jgi:hypothetical protein
VKSGRCVIILFLTRWRCIHPVVCLSTAWSAQIRGSWGRCHLGRRLQGPRFTIHRETRAANQCSVYMFQETPLFLGGGLFGPGSFGGQRKRLCTYEGCLTPSCEREGIHVGSAALLGSAKRRTSPDKKCTSPRTSFQCIHYFSDMVG